MSALESKIPVFDPSGKVESWLNDGAAIAVWQNHDMSSSRLGTYMFTREDAPDTGIASGIVSGGHAIAEPITRARPHWAYEYVRTATRSDLILYRKADVLARYSFSEAGRKAAYRLLNTLERDARHYEVWQSESPAPSPYVRRNVGGRSTLIDRRPHWDAAIGRIYQTWSVELVDYRSKEEIPYPLASTGTRPLDVLSFWSVVTWLAGPVAEPGS